MNSQNIVFTEKNVAKVLTEPLTDPAPYEIVVKTAVSTISSGTERANLTGDPTVGIYSYDTVAHFPRRLGYSSAGTVIQVGSAVTRVKVGDRVALSGGAHSEYNRIHESAARVLPDNVAFEDAAIFEIGSFPLAAIRKCRLEMGESAIVMGQGVLGQIAVMLLKIAGAAPIIAVDPLEEKRARALELGADWALDPFADDFAARVKELTNGGANVAIEVTGNAKALDQVLDGMAKFGRVALLGCTRHSDFCIDYYHKVHGPGITLIGAHNCARPAQDSAPGWWTSYDDVMTLVKFTAMKRISLASLVEETHSPAEAPAVYGRLATEKGFPVVQFDWRRLS